MTMKAITKCMDYSQYAQVDGDAHCGSQLGLSPTGQKLSQGENDNTGENESDNRFASLAKRFKIEVCDNGIDSVLASNINELFKQGMEEEQYN